MTDENRRLVFSSSSHFSIGVKIEFQALDRDCLNLVPLTPLLADHSPKVAVHRISHEFIRSMLELHTFARYSDTFVSRGPRYERGMDELRIIGPRFISQGHHVHTGMSDFVTVEERICDLPEKFDDIVDVTDRIVRCGTRAEYQMHNYNGGGSFQKMLF